MGVKLPPLRLSQRLLLQVAFAMAGLAAVGGVGLVGVASLNHQLDASLREYEQIRWASEFGVRVVRLRDGLASGVTPADTARSRLVLLRAELDGPADPSRRVHEAAAAHREELSAALDEAAAALAPRAGATPPADARRAAALHLNRVLNLISTIAAEGRGRIAAIDDDAETAQQRTLIALIAATCLGTLGLLGAGWRHHRAVMDPLRELQAGASRLAAGDLSGRVHESGDHELSQLARGFNEMAEQLESLYTSLETQVRERSTQLARSDRFAAVGTLAAGVAHEVNNPLGIIAGQAEMALRAIERETPGQGQQPAAASASLSPRLAAIRDEAFRCKAIIERLMSLARPTSSEHHPLDLAATVREVMPLLVGEASRTGITLDLSAPDEPLWVSGDAAELKQILINLVLNALSATRDQGERITVSLSAEGDAAQLRVADDGVGMDQETLENVLEPFFTTRKGVREAGSGLGLTVSLAIAEEHGGTLRAASDGPGLGSVFTVSLPRLLGQEEAAPQLGATSPDGVPHG